jgi:hypothetical protein
MPHATMLKKQAVRKFFRLFGPEIFGSLRQRRMAKTEMINSETYLAASKSSNLTETM